VPCRNDGSSLLPLWWRGCKGPSTTCAHQVKALHTWLSRSFVWPPHHVISLICTNHSGAHRACHLFTSLAKSLEALTDQSAAISRHCERGRCPERSPPVIATSGRSPTSAFHH
jgi:hypothetical protein